MLLTDYVPYALLAATTTLGIVVIMGLLLLTAKGRTGIPRNLMRRGAPPLPVPPLGKADTVPVVEPGDGRRPEVDDPVADMLPKLADSFLGPVAVEPPHGPAATDPPVGHGIPGDDLLPGAGGTAAAAEQDRTGLGT